MNILYKYNAFTRNALKEKYTYRFKAIMWALSSVFNMLVQYYLWKSIYSEVNGTFFGVSQTSYLMYIGFGVVCYSMTSCMENMTIAEDIKSGNISMNLIKPFNYKYMVLFRHIGSKLGEIIGLVPVIIIVCLLLRGSEFDIVRILLFIISLVLAFGVSFLFSYIMGLVTFWTTNYWGLQFFTGTLMGLFSGQLMAINFYIDIGKGTQVFNSTLSFLNAPVFTEFFRVLGILAYCLPFQSMYYTPMSILSGIIDSSDQIIIHLLLQVWWLVCLSVIAELLWKCGQKKITILGG